jgi:Na+/H+ antiporter NhaD/arsenite permease-like protein
VSASVEIGGQLGFWTLAPFGCMLLAVAIMPLVAERWFHHNWNKSVVAFVLGAPTLIYLFGRFGRTGLELAGSTAEEYVSFIILLFALFTISGGIYLTGNVIASPWHNLAFLATGAVLASWIGTMGASMVLIRPLLRANSDRTHSRHTVIFFIFAVSNVGGLLTPLGDPPLFLGFLRGVPFAWTLSLWAEWLLSVGLVLLVYMALELYYYRREPEVALRRDLADYVPMRIKGWINVVPLALVIVTVLFSGPLKDAGKVIHFPFVREVILVVLAVLSLKLCPRGPRAANSFHWSPMIEVAVLFAGIFATMIPALALLQTHGASIGLTQPWHYFWATGSLSSFLDNAPTYLTFASLAQGQVGAATVGALTSTQVVAGLGYSTADFLRAISCGAVMMGAMTYVGNAPNFAVKAIAEHSGLKMPSFFHYMGYSIAVLVPIFVIVTAIFFL